MKNKGKSLTDMNHVQLILSSFPDPNVLLLFSVIVSITQGCTVHFQVIKYYNQLYGKLNKPENNIRKTNIFSCPSP